MKRLEELVDIDLLEKLQNNFSKLLGSVTIIEDLDGSPITQLSGLCDYCKLFRSTKEGLKRCRKSTSALVNEDDYLKKGYYVFTCEAGIRVMASPIFLRGKKIAYLVSSIRSDNLVYKDIKVLAGKIGVDPDKLWNYFVDFPTISPEKALPSAQYMSSVGSIISELSNKAFALQEMLYSKEKKIVQLEYELSTPLVKLKQSIGLVTLTGTIDDERGNIIKEKLLRESLKMKITTIILDITGTTKIDLTAADILRKTVQGLKLLGIKVVMVGVSPVLARAMVEIGFSLEGLSVFCSLEQIIENIEAGKTL